MCASDVIIRKDKIFYQMIDRVQKSRKSIMNFSLLFNHQRGTLSIPSLLIRILKKNVFYFKAPEPLDPVHRNAQGGEQRGGQANKGGSQGVALRPGAVRLVSRFPLHRGNYRSP